MENVEEIQTWGPLLASGKPDPKHKGRTWKAFLAALGGGVAPGHPDLDEMLEVLGGSVARVELIRGFGYDVETRELRACDYGALVRANSRDMAINKFRRTTRTNTKHEHASTCPH